MRKPRSPKVPKIPRRTVDRAILSPRDHRYVSKKRTGRAALRAIQVGGDVSLINMLTERRDFERDAGAIRYEPKHRARSRAQHSGYRGRHRK